MNIIYECYVGSKLYNLENINSDIDIKGIYDVEPSDILGLENKTDSHVDNICQMESEKKTESVHYSFLKFIKLALKQNPTILEMAYVSKPYVKLNKATHILALVKDHIVSKGLIKSYTGYINDQMNIVRKDKVSNNRETIVKQYGYDIKSASHIVRLQFQLLSFLKNGFINPTLCGSEQETVLSIKNGKISKIEFFEIAIDVQEQTNKFDGSLLKNEPNYEIVNDFVIQHHKDIIND